MGRGFMVAMVTRLFDRFGPLTPQSDQVKIKLQSGKNSNKLPNNRHQIATLDSHLYHLYH